MKNTKSPILKRVASYTETLRNLRASELRKSAHEPCLLCKAEAGLCKCMQKDELSAKTELCMHCGSKDCKCPGVLAGDKKVKDVTPKDSGHGGKAKPLGKGDVPMAAAPTKAGTSTHPTAKVGAPKVGGPPGAPMAKATPQDKKAMAQHAIQAGSKAAAIAGAGAAPVGIVKPVQLAPDAQASRQTQYADFTPAGAFAAPAHGAAAGEMKPIPEGTAGLKAPGAAIQAVPGKAVGTIAAPSRLARFTAALKGHPAQKSEVIEISLRKSLGSCLLCRCPEHAGACES